MKHYWDGVRLLPLCVCLAGGVKLFHRSVGCVVPLVLIAGGVLNL